VCYRPVFTTLFLFFLHNAFCETLDTAFVRRHLVTNVYSIDSEASAVVLFENHTVYITFQGDHLEQRERIEKTIKILKQDATSLGNVAVFYPSDNIRNYVFAITGITFNIEDGKVISSLLPEEDRYKKSLGNNYYEIDFLMPGVRAGSIINYSYEIISQPGALLPIWRIQSQYPKLVSEYQIYYPPQFEYTLIYHVNDKVTNCSSQRDAELNPAPFRHVIKTSANSQGTSSSFWTKRNIVAIKDEPYISNINKEAERLEIQMTGMSVQGKDFHFINSWEKINDGFWKDNYDKLIYGKNKFLNKVVDSLSEADTSEAGMIRSIYMYVRAHFSCISSNSYVVVKNLEEVFKNRKGSIGEINMLLTAMLAHADINAVPMILNTTDQIPLSPTFPVIDRFDYLACVITKRDSTRLYLDASDKNNIFGMLPYYCYNGYAWILGFKGQGITLAREMIKDKTVLGVKIYNITDSNAKIEIVEKLGLIQSATIRKSYEKDTGALHAYIEKESHNFASNINIAGSAIENERNPDTNLIFKYAGNFEFEKTNGTYFIAATLLKLMQTNPFRSTARKLPIEFPYKTEYKYFMNISLPEYLEPEAFSKPTLLDFENRSMAYEKMINYNSTLRAFTVNINYEINTTTYTSDYNKSLRDFFQDMIVQNNEIVTFKKVK